MTSKSELKRLAVQMKPEDIDAMALRVAEEVKDAMFGRNICTVEHQYILAVAHRIIEEYCKGMEPVAWMCGTGFPQHIDWKQSISETKLYGEPRPLFLHPADTRTNTETLSLRGKIGELQREVERLEQKVREG